MKKILAIILVLSTLFCSTTVWATDVASVDGKDYSKVLYLFEYLDALSGQSWEEVDPSQVISRGEFVSICTKALQLSLEQGEKYFYDVDKESVHYHSVSYLVNVGVLSVGADRIFRPNDGILYSEALKILLTLAGYDEYADANGGYPFGYMQTANRFELAMDKGAEDVMLYGEALELMFRIMTTGIYDLKMISEDSKRYFVSFENTLLSIHRDLYINRGTVDTTSIFSMNGTVCSPQEAYIDGVRYQLQSGVNMIGFEGNYVEFIYQGNNTTNTLIYLEALPEREDVSITSKEYVEFDPNSYTLTYYDNIETGHKASVKIDKKWDVVFNGRGYGGSLSKALQGFTTGERKGNIEIKKNNNNQDAVVIIKSYRRYVVRSYDLNNRTLYNKFATSDGVKFGDYQVVSIRTKDGKEVKEDEIVPETALLIAASDDGTFLDILMPGKIVTTTIESIHTKRTIATGEGNLTVDENEWKRIQGTGILKPGTLYTLWIDAFGEVAYMNVAQTNDILTGFIVDSSVQESFNSIKVQVKMFAQDGTMQVLNFAKHINIDEVSYGKDMMLQALFAIPETESMSGFSINQAKSRVENIRLKKQLVRYSTNSSGEIVAIDTYRVNTEAGETAETSLTKQDKRDVTLRYRTIKTAGRFDRDVLYHPTTTTVFTVPWTDDDGYMIQGQESDTIKIDDTLSYQLSDNGSKKREEDVMYQIGGTFNDYQYYNVDAYHYNGNNPYVDVLVHHDDFIGNGLYAQVCELTRTMDEKGTLGYGIRTLGPKGEGYYFTELESEVAGLKVGDIFHGEFYGDRIYKITKRFDAESREFVGSSSEVEAWYHTNYNVHNQFSRGTVTKLQGDCVYSKYDMSSTETEFDEAADLSLIGFTVYERNRNNEPTVKMGTTDRIKEAFVAADDASYIVLMSNQVQPTYAFIFNGR